jgi:hypothetical protein
MHPGFCKWHKLLVLYDGKLKGKIEQNTFYFNTVDIPINAAGD